MWVGTAKKVLKVWRNDFLVPISFPLPSNHSHSHSHSHPFPFPAATMNYLKAEKYVYCVVNSKNEVTAEALLIKLTIQTSSLLWLSLPSTVHCSTFIRRHYVYCAKTAGCSHCRWEFYYNMLFPFPLELFPFQFQLVAQNYSHSHGNPVGMGSPIFMHTSSHGPDQSTTAEAYISTAWRRGLLVLFLRTWSMKLSQLSKVTRRQLRRPNAHRRSQGSKVRQTWICIAPRREHTSKALRYCTRYQGISQCYLHTPRSPQAEKESIF